MKNVLTEIRDRAAFRAWLESHGDETECWVHVKRGRPVNDGTFYYLDAVEEALCFGWIDSTMKRIDEGKPIQHFTPRRKGSNWCEQNLVRCRRLLKLGEMTPAGLSVAPDLNPRLFVFEDWILDAIKADKPAWKHFKTFPENYRRIKVDRIQHYQHTGRQEYAQKMLTKFIQDCHAGKMQSGWSDFGRLEIL